MILNNFKRCIIIDIETTGLYSSKGDKIIEIAAIEVIDGIFTGNVFHNYINPGIKIKKSAYKIHGICDKFLLNKPSFKDIYLKFLNFVSGAPLVAHNANFDSRFLYSEFKNININYKFIVVDTLPLFRFIFPNKKNNLSAIVKRLKIESLGLTHSAFFDAFLLARCYIFIIFIYFNLIRTPFWGVFLIKNY